MSRVYEGRSVLVTGAGGSIGSELCRLVMSQDAKRLVLVSLTEAGLYNVTRRLEHEFRKYRDTQLVPLLGDAADPAFMYEALAGVDLVVHAAAHKHVPICESNPIEAIANNVFGTLNVLEQARLQRVSQFCLISSDKAVKPTSIMGATKRLAELIVANHPASAPQAFVVRFGNVMDSAGSVLPLWREQIAAGNPITLTDERCTRYFMSIADAVDLITAAIALKPACGTFVLDMGEPVSLLRLAEKVLRDAGIAWTREREHIKVIGLRPGEKLQEELHYGGDLRPTGVPKLFQVIEPMSRLDSKRVGYLRACCQDRRHDRARELLWELVGAIKEAA